ncbi:ATP-binding protein [Streptomyces sp. NPDC050610]|uniref:ATP-binding protein n=1 Tax=Streptomyces sp. NPDC050610 TaxID=3157097 RepID=UPI003423C479
MDEYTSRVRVWGLICPGSEEEVARARRWIRDILSAHPCADDAELIVSELSTNALTHTASGSETGTLQITLAVTPLFVAISVTDDGGHPTAPHVTHAADDATHGRGLSIVMTLAARLDITGNDHGRTVTAELRPPLAGTAPC